MNASRSAAIGETAKVMSVLAQGHHPARRFGEVRQFPLGVLEPETETTGAFATLRVVTAGRGPEQYGAAYGQLRTLLAQLGLEADLVLPTQLNVSTVHTASGPGMALGVVVTLPGPEPAPEEGTAG